MTPLPPAAENDAVCGLMVMAPLPPVWVTITKAPPTAILPHRGDTFGVCATVKLALPLPAPEPGDPTLIQKTEATAVHEHPDVAVTGITPVPPAAANACAPPTEP